MFFRRVGSSYIIRLQKGEEIIETLRNFAMKYGVTAGAIRGIGATDDCVIGYYDSEAKVYREKHIQEGMEILNLQGNVSMGETMPILHIHIILGDSEYNVTGGHLISANVSVTCEVVMEAMDTIVHREYDEETQLKLMKL